MINYTASTSSLNSQCSEGQVSPYIVLPPVKSIDDHIAKDLDVLAYTPMFH